MYTISPRNEDPPLQGPRKPQEGGARQEPGSAMGQPAEPVSGRAAPSRDARHRAAPPSDH